MKPRREWSCSSVIGRHLQQCGHGVVQPAAGRAAGVRPCSEVGDEAIGIRGPAVGPALHLQAHLDELLGVVEAIGIGHDLELPDFGRREGQDGLVGVLPGLQPAELEQRRYVLQAVVTTLLGMYQRRGLATDCTVDALGEGLMWRHDFSGERPVRVRPDTRY
jgi:hypothetical protein